MSHIRSKQAVKKSWFFTESGKTFSLYVANAVSTAVLFGHVLPHTLLVTTYKNFVRLYSKGFSVPVPEKIDKRFNKTLELLKIDELDQWRYSPFMACGFDMISMGTYGRFGIHIGIPVNFDYDSVESIDKSRIMVNQESVIWDTDAGKQLLNALVVPENGQLYAIAREIKMRQSWKIFYDTFYGIMGCSLTYVCSAALNEKLKLYNKPRKIRFIGYGLAALLNFANYLMCKDLTQNIYEARIDKELKALHPVFAEGGKQFYTKILERNKALRVLMGPEGEKMYTVTGNENFLIRNKHRPIVERKAFFEESDEPKSTPGQDGLAA